MIRASSLYLLIQVLMFMLMIKTTVILFLAFFILVLIVISLRSMFDRFFEEDQQS